MRLVRLRIQNFRCFDDEVIEFGPYNSFVGPNGAGKSTVLTALNILFRYSDGPGSLTTLTEEDFHLGDTNRPVEITATFSGLSSQAKQDLKAYVRQQKLVLTAKASWDESQGQAEVQQHGQRLVMPQFVEYFEADDEGAKAADLKDIYQQLRSECPALPDVWVKAEMKSALREYEEKHPDECELIQSSDHFYGWSRGANRLDKYVQWVYIPAVKDATEEQDEDRNTALGRLLQRTIRKKVDFTEDVSELREELGEKYRQLLRTYDPVLDDVGQSIQQRLRKWAHPGAKVKLAWHYDEQRSVTLSEPAAHIKVGEHEFLGEILRAGHGMQRSFLLALLHELAKAGANSADEPVLLLGIEEPELYQHPPQARHLRALLETLSDTNSQVFVTTHSTYFISAQGVPSVRMTRRPSGGGGTRVTSATLKQVSALLADALNNEPQEPTALMAKIHQIMQPGQRELFFSRVPVLVEGPEDVAFLSTHLHLTERWEEFRTFGCHFVQCNGKGPMSRPLAVAQAFAIPVFCVFDADASDTNQSNITDNTCLLRLLGYDDEPMPESNLVRATAVVWRSKILDEVRKEIGHEVWDAAEDAAREKTKMTVGVRRKDALLVSATLEELWKDDVRSAVLERAVDAILNHAVQVVATE